MTWLDDRIASSSNPTAPTIPTRAIGTAFQPSLTHWTDCSYTIEHVAAHGNDGTVELRSDAANPPTTVRDCSRLAVTDDAAAITIRQTLRYKCPPGDWIKLVGAGTGTSAIVAEYETVKT